MQMLADVLNMPVNVATSDQTCALGSAMFAAVASGEFINITDAMASMGQGIEQTYYPDAEKSAIYNKLFAQYLQAGSVLEHYAII